MSNYDPDLVKEFKYPKLGLAIGILLIVAWLIIWILSYGWFMNE